jgi:hypothetical protein
VPSGAVPFSPRKIGDPAGVVYLYVASKTTSSLAGGSPADPPGNIIREDLRALWFDGA